MKKCNCFSPDIVSCAVIQHPEESIQEAIDNPCTCYCHPENPRTVEQIIECLDSGSPLIEKLLVYFMVKKGLIADPKTVHGGMDSFIFDTLLDAQEQNLIPGYLNDKQSIQTD
jgi:hypothetical protein